MFDGMAVVNQIKKSDAIRTCKDFAKVFVARVLHAAESYSEVRLTLIGTLLHLSRGRQETSELVVLSHASKLVITH